MLMKLFYSAACLLLFTTNVVASGDPVAGKEKSGICAACHGADGNSTIPAWPKIAGQHEDYLYQQLLDFKSGKRDNPQMLPLLMTFNEEDLSNVAAFYASQKQTPGTANKTITIGGEEVEANIIDAEFMYRVGNPDAGLSACTG